ncbi:MAG: DUF2306 domain-containing protein [Acidobacteriia bacterium]|nr:DUF2306 domain-containing protein [Terriglobia bacterium]
MSTAVVVTNRLDVSSVADTALKAAVQFWFVVSIIGQWAFLFYIVAFYGPSTLTGNFEAWRKNAFPIRSYVPGDTAGNLAFAAHALLAAVITFGGAIQLIPQIRSRAISVHRWIGRLFMVTALGLSVSGLYVIWTRNHGGIARIANTTNAVLIIVFSVLAWRSALRRDLSIHRRWALRTYMATSAQWFGRVGIFAWIVLNRGPVGLGDNFDGPVAIFWSFGCYLLPLAVLELYLRAKESAGPGQKLAVASTLVGLTLASGVGVIGVGMAGWVPSVKAALDARKSIAATLSTAITSSGIDQATKLYYDLKATQPTAYNFAEKELNTLGYDLMGARKFKEAIRIFRLNVEAYPQSSNAYASLAEAYMGYGNKAEASANCQKSLQLNPKNRRAIRVLQKLSVP